MFILRHRKRVVQQDLSLICDWIAVLEEIIRLVHVLGLDAHECIVVGLFEHLVGRNLNGRTF